MSRNAIATINVAAFQHNYQFVKQLAPNSRALAVIKANGYGHGAVMLAKSLPDADAFAVASVDEALELREAGIGQPIILLEGFFDSSEWTAIVENDLELVIHCRQQLDELLQAQLSVPVKVWLKLDSGMHRLGFSPEQYRTVYQELRESKNVVDICLMTHFASADTPDNAQNQQQLACFKETVEDLKGATSLANSAALIAFPEAQGDWVRPGIMLYGSNPFAEASEVAAQLQPVMTLSSQLIAIHQVAEGECVGYGQAWCASKPSRIGIVAMGYADGYPRHTPSGTPVLVNGQRVPLVGRVSMDMLAVDITALAETRLGNEVVLWGEGLPVDEIAHAAQTISYELLTGINRRVSKKYIGV